MAKSKVDLSDLLEPSVDLSDLLPPELPKEALSAPEIVIVHWLRQTCICGRSYESEEYGATIRHTLLRRHGFGLHPVGKVHIPVVPGLDLSDLPVEVQVKSTRIFACPSCIGSRPSLPLFSEDPVAFLVAKNGTCASPHVMLWEKMHETSPKEDLDRVRKDIEKRKLDFDDLLTFKTTQTDLASAFRDLSTVDPEE